MTTWEEYKAEALKDPELKREYDAQAEEFRRISEEIRAEIRAEEEERRRASAPPNAPRLHSPSILLYRRRKNGIKKTAPRAAKQISTYIKELIYHDNARNSNQRGECPDPRKLHKTAEHHGHRLHQRTHRRASPKGTKRIPLHA